jgi:hypothetical protein
MPLSILSRRAVKNLLSICYIPVRYYNLQGYKVCQAEIHLFTQTAENTVFYRIHYK